MTATGETSRRHVRRRSSRDRAPEDEPATDFRWDASGQATLPRAKAIENLEAAIEGAGGSEGAARVIARGAVRPDEMRLRLARPAELRVPGGVLLVVETPVWSAAVVPYPNNPRELGTRVYPLAVTGDVAPENRPLADPVEQEDRPFELTLAVANREHLAARLRGAELWLTEHNPLAGDIGDQGVLQPVTLVALTVEHADGQPPVTVLAAADGSSRTSAAHILLGLDAGDIAYHLGRDDRAFRQTVGAVIRAATGDGWADLTEARQRGARVLTLPARVIVGWRPNPGSAVTFPDAIRALIGLMHINPPRSYGSAVENNAVADAVLDTLRRPLRTRPPVLDDYQRRWFAATMTERERAQADLPPELDVRAAQIVRHLLFGGRTTAGRVNRGIRAVTAESSPTANNRVDVCVELILRPWFSVHTDEAPSVRTARRAALQRALRMAEISDEPNVDLFEDQPGNPDRWSLEEVRDTALTEIADTSSASGLQSAQVELAIKALYYMVTAEPMAVRRERVGRLDASGGQKDGRSPALVLREMVSTERGVWQAYAFVVAGRDGLPLYEVDTGGEETAVNGSRTAVDDDLLRSTYGGTAATAPVIAGPALARERWAAIRANVAELEMSVKLMSAVMTEAGPSLVESDGWRADEVKSLRDRVDRVDRALGNWEDRWKLEHEDEGEDAVP